jgi:hypothetical protein
MRPDIAGIFVILIVLAFFMWIGHKEDDDDDFNSTNHGAMSI